MDGWTPPRANSSADRKLISDVESSGWALVNIAASRQEPGFSYTVGLWRTWHHGVFEGFDCRFDQISSRKQKAGFP
jgi:hypothetical protein